MKKIHKIIGCSAIAASIALTVGFFFKKGSSDVSYEDVQLFQVKRSDLHESIYLTASVVSDNIEIVYSDYDAPVAEVKVSVGDTVKAGDVICVYDTSQLQKDHDNYVIFLEQVQKLDSLYAENFDSNNQFEKSILENQIEQIKNQIEINRKKYDETVALANEYRSIYNNAAAELNELGNIIEANKNAEINSGSENENSDEGSEGYEADETETAYDPTPDLYELAVKKREASYEKQCEAEKNAEEINDTIISYQRQLDSLMVDYNGLENFSEKYYTDEKRDEMIRFYTEKVNELKEMIEQSAVKAGCDGVVTDLYITPNSYVKENRVCCIQDPEKVHFSGFMMPEDYLDVSEESNLLVSLAANDYDETEGKITFISDNYNYQQNGYEFNFTIENINSYDLYPGLVVSARIELQSQKDTLIVPYDAVFETGDGSYVRKYDESGISKDISVKRGLSTSYYVSVESPELSENDFVATNMLG